MLRLKQEMEDLPPEATRIVEGLASRQGTDRKEAEQAVGASGQAGIELLLHILERENRTKPLRYAVGVTAAFLVILFLMLMISTVWEGFQPGSVSYAIYMLAAGFGAQVAPTRLQRAAARLLAECDDLRAVGPLAEALKRQDSGTRKAAIRALIRLLPRLQASDSDLLNDAQRDCLRGALSEDGGDAELILTILKMYEQVGDTRALPVVEKMSEGKGRAKKDARIREAARTCLPFLRERAEQERVRATLLRPAAAPANPSEVLLRPAQGSQDADPDMLLRPAPPTE